MPTNAIGWGGNLAANTDRGPTRAIWNDLPLALIQQDPNVGFHRFEDWSDLPLPPTLTTQIAFGKYKAFATTGSSVSRVSAVNSVEVIGGALKLATDTDNDSAIVGDAAPANLILTNSKTTSGKLWFECCIAQKSVATNMASTFIGLGETDLMTFATALPFNAGDPITNDGALFGFHLSEDGLGVIDTVVSDRATSYTVIGTGEGGTLVAYTFKKLGFVYDLDEVAANRVTFYTDGLPCATRYTGANIAATTNLKANPLGFLFGTVADSGGTAHEVYCKWARWAQLYPSTSNVPN